MKHELMNSLAKVRAMRAQCLDARKKIESAKEAIHDDVQNDIEITGVMARKGTHNADVAYANMLKHRGFISG